LFVYLKQHSYINFSPSRGAEQFMIAEKENIKKGQVCMLWCDFYTTCKPFSSFEAKNVLLMMIG
jgi:hypothetical protein